MKKVGDPSDFPIIKLPFSHSMTHTLLSPEEQKPLLEILKTRFDKHPSRHTGVLWDDVEKRLTANPEKLAALSVMEQTGGEPDVTGYDARDGVYTFVDCAVESPTGRRSLCYDRAALDGRKENKPKESVLDMVSAMGVTLLTEDEYRHLQSLGQFDLKTSSWIATPLAIRALGGALFCDRRYDMVFTYHNGADSYYAARGWRGKVGV